MGSQSTKRPTKAKADKSPTLKERIRSRKVINARSKRISELTPAERRAELARLEKDLAEHAPSLKVAKSDLLRALQLIGAEFVRRYYPDANFASFSVTRSLLRYTHMDIPIPKPKDPAAI